MMRVENTEACHLSPLTPHHLTTSPRRHLTISSDPATGHGYPRAGWLAQGLKRLFDVLVAMSALVLLAPLFVLIAVCIKLDSPGPVFFCQVRVGRHRRRFRMWKFRKMRHDMPAQGPSLTRRYDVRLTPIGRLLERTKLDELPQLINVLGGDMSIVGPRPEVPKFVECYPDEWTRVLSVRPGLVGPSQLLLRNESELFPDSCGDVEEYYAEHILPKKLAIDGAYAAGHSLVSDLVLLMRTIPVTLGGVLTRRTLVNRRWQAVNAAGLIVISAAGSLVAACALGPRLGLAPTWQLVGLAVAAKIVSIALFGLPSSMASSVTAADLLRCCWCAAMAGLLAGSVLLLGGFSSPSGEAAGLVLLADTIAFTACLMVYKLGCYNLYVLFRLQKSSDLARRLTVAALFLGPLSAAMALARHPQEHWSGQRGLAFLGILLLASVVRPGVILFNPMSSNRQGLSWMVTEWVKLALGALAGSFLLLVALFAIGERAAAPRDAGCDAVIYLALITAFAIWHQRPRASSQTPTADANTAKERLLVVGSGLELGAYLSALLILAEHSFEVVGAVVVGTGHRANTVAGVRVVGEVTDVPEIVTALSVTRVVVVGGSGDDSILSYLRLACPLSEHGIARIDFLAPLRASQPDGVASGLSSPW
jgi:lipopolysaccharide/colanic/teichoic acid biosynthesis glycosyltransferase